MSTTMTTNQFVYVNYANDVVISNLLDWQKMTPEQAHTWIDKVEELEGDAFAGKGVSDEEVLRLGNYYLSGEYLIRNLEIVNKKKQEALLGLAQLEAAEKRITDKMREQKINFKFAQSNE